ncbi:unnamed protein product [Allacma fusca]|uniref:Uncharacterized protein n=1 Tax=Allacma fusca TaxID=39272 RepID=A0A8J2JP88_9HEXA|nr:unnamed protein product [Allacma fusca]
MRKRKLLVSAPSTSESLPNKSLKTLIGEEVQITRNRVQNANMQWHSRISEKSSNLNSDFSYSQWENERKEWELDQFIKWKCQLANLLFQAKLLLRHDVLPNSVVQDLYLSEDADLDDNASFVTAQSDLEDFTGLFFDAED